MDFNELQSNYKKIKIREGKHKSKLIKEYSRISVNCLIDSKNHINNDIHKIITHKILLVTLTAILTYLGIYQITFKYIKNQITKLQFYLFIFLLIGIGIGILIYFITKKNYIKTQFMLFFIIYSIISFAGIIMMIIKFMPFTSYSIINTYFVILIIQLLLFIIITPIVKKLVCRVNLPYEVL